MADNTTLNAGSGGDVIATDDIAGVKHQLVKIEYGAADSATPVSTSNPLPVTLANTGSNATAVKVDGSAVTQPVSDGSGSLTVDNAGTFSVQVSSNIPGTGATNLGKAEDAAHSSGDTGVLALGVRQDTLASSTSADGDYAALKVSAAGRLYVDAAITSGAGSGGTSVADAATFTRGTTSETPVGGVVETSAPTLTNGQAGALSLTTGGALRVAVASGGVAGVVEDAASAGGEEGVLCMTVRQDTPASSTSADGDFQNLKTDSVGRLHTAPVGPAAQDAAISGNPLPVGLRASTATPTAMSADGDVVYQWATREGAVVVAGRIVDDAPFTVGTDRVHPIGLMADESSTDSVDEGDVGVARMTLDRKAVVSNYAHMAGGWTPNLTVSAASTNATSLKGSAGQVGYIVVTNVNAAMRYLKLYNKATSPTVGTDTPVLVIPIPGNTAGAGCALNFGPGVEFTTGIAWALTSGAGNSDTGAVSASEHVVSIGYK